MRERRSSIQADAEPAFGREKPFFLPRENPGFAKDFGSRFGVGAGPDLTYAPTATGESRIGRVAPVLPEISSAAGMSSGTVPNPVVPARRGS